MRKLTGHIVNPANDLIDISVMDNPGLGGACSQYRVSYQQVSDPEHGTFAAPVPDPTFITFQDGPIADVGINGLTHEVLLEILRDRLLCYQGGPYANGFNQAALEHIIAAQDALKARTLERMQRGVEGTHQV